ncbi:hypothetical protein I4U23_001862 [Adineta vaga]|nr:hypothetical protein I4U23_001862 [Adineta vaga]
MDGLYDCIRIMKISSEKLQSTRYSESLRHTTLIRSTFSQSRKQFCELFYSFLKTISTTQILLPILIQNQEFLLPDEQTMNTSSQKRKSSHVDTVKRLRITST